MMGQAAGTAVSQCIKENTLQKTLKRENEKDLAGMVLFIYGIESEND